MGHWPTLAAPQIFPAARVRAFAVQYRKKTKPRAGPFQTINGSGGRIRTYDLRVMSPTSCQTAPPRTSAAVHGSHFVAVRQPSGIEEEACRDQISAAACAQRSRRRSGNRPIPSSSKALTLRTTLKSMATPCVLAVPPLSNNIRRMTRR